MVKWTETHQLNLDQVHYVKIDLLTDLEKNKKCYWTGFHGRNWMKKMLNSTQSCGLLSLISFPHGLLVFSHHFFTLYSVHWSKRVSTCWTKKKPSPLSKTAVIQNSCSSIVHQYFISVLFHLLPAWNCFTWIQCCIFLLFPLVSLLQYLDSVLYL